MEEAVRAELLEALRPLCKRKTLLENVPLSSYTTLGVGGAAEIFCEVTAAEQLKEVLRIAWRLSVPVTVLGNGSNTLVRDGGVPGLTLHIGEGMAEVSQPVPLPDGRMAITAQAGASLVRLANAAADASLTGLEFAGGIPGTVGGAVAMNAGAYGGEISDVLLGATCVTLSGESSHYTKDDMRFAYRTSRLNDPRAPREILVSATFALALGDGDAIRVAMREFNARRREKQPLTMPCCGSTFKRPQGGFAGTLIENCGLKGLRVGGASVSMQHAGFLINDENGNASDYLALIAKVQQTVWEKTGVMLEPEVRIIGVDP